MSLQGDFPETCTPVRLHKQPLRANAARSTRRERQDGLRQPNTLPLTQVHRARRVFREDQAAFRAEVDLDEIAQFHLTGRNEVGKRKHEILLDGWFQMPSSVEHALSWPAQIGSRASAIFAGAF